MTVKELIERLQQMPQDCQVIVYEDTTKAGHNVYVMDVVQDEYPEDTPIVEIWY